jgi:hypothetical protein
LHRLKFTSRDVASTSYEHSLGFSYNPASQIKQNTRSNDSYAWNGHYNVTRAYTSNGLNQYTASGSATLTYDSNGNLSFEGSTSYVYDDENRLVSASGGHSALAYDPLGRLWQTVGSVTGTTDFEYDSGSASGTGTDRLLEEWMVPARRRLPGTRLTEASRAATSVVRGITSAPSLGDVPPGCE